MKIRPPVLAFAGLVVALAAVACGGGGSDATPTRASSGTGATSTATSRSAAAGNEAVAALQKLAVPAGMADGMALGKAGTPATLTIFEDFQCPYCLRFTADFEGLIFDEYVKPGKLRVEFRNLPILGPESEVAAAAAWCAGQQNQFWAYEKKLFLVEAEAGQLTSEKIGVGRFATDQLKAAADDVGLDRAKFDACIVSGAASAAVNDDVRQARSIGLRGTPSFLVNGQPLADTPATAAAWRKVLDSAVAAR